MAEESARNNTARNTTAEEIMKHAEASAQSGSNMNSTRRSKKRKFNNNEMIVLGNPLGSRREDSPTQGTSTRFNTGFNFNQGLKKGSPRKSVIKVPPITANSVSNEKSMAKTGYSVKESIDTSVLGHKAMLDLG